LAVGAAERGWVVGENVRLEIRYGAVDAARAATAALELLEQRPRALVANSNIAVEQILRASRTTPLVFVAISDPIDAGFVQTFARPAGNATGFTDFEPSHAGKWLSLLASVFPNLHRVGLAFNPGSAPRNGWFFMTPFMDAALALGMEPLALRFAQSSDIESVFAAQAGVAGTGVVIAPDAFTLANRSAILRAVAINGLPAIYPYASYVQEGGLMAYAVDLPTLFQRAGQYVGRILNGDDPSNLPVQAPSVFELSVNLRTANAMAVTVPIDTIATADRIIE